MSDEGEFVMHELSANGECRGRDALGRELWVRGALPGDVVRPLGVPQRGQRLRSFALLRPSPARRDSPCSVQAACGGCALMPLEASAQRDLKLGMLRRELAAQGVQLPEILWGEAPYRLAYRNRVRLRLEAGRFRFFNAAKLPDCAVLVPELGRAVNELVALSAREPHLFEAFTHAELRAPDADGRLGAAFAGALPVTELRARLPGIAARLPAYLLGVRGDREISWQRRALLPEVWSYVPLDAFLQVNDDVNARLLRSVLDRVRRCGLHSVLDLYAGAGNFSLALLRAGCAVTAVESHGTAVNALIAAARAQELACEALASAASSSVTSLLTASRRFDCVIVDAPRAGPDFALSTLRELGARQVLVCACYAPALARTVRELEAAGYVTREIVAWDMFRATHHVETLAWLERT